MSFACNLLVAAWRSGLGFDYRLGQMKHSFAIAATFLRSCVAQGLSLEVAPPLVTRHGVLPRDKRRFDLLLSCQVELIIVMHLIQRQSWGKITDSWSFKV